jgi:hypothetical protein
MKALPLKKAVSYALSPALTLKTLRAERVLRTIDTANTEFCRAFDERFDLFWNELRRKHSTVLLALRSREFLEWHFRFPMIHDRLWILTTSKGSVLDSYAIFCRQDNPAFGLKRIRLIDFRSLADAEALLPMLAEALKMCRREGIHMLVWIGITPDCEPILQHLASQQRLMPCWLYYYKAKNPGLAQTLNSPTAWNPSCFDGDSSL